MISREARPWPAREKEYTELLVGDYCAHGRPKKGRPVLAYFDNPPRCDTWAVLCLHPAAPSRLQPSTRPLIYKLYVGNPQFHMIYRRDFKLGE